MKETIRWTAGALLGLGVLALAIPAQAADRSALDANRAARFKELDRDGNGSISRDEYGGHPGNFRALDQNKDGVLGRDEFVDRSGVRPEEAAPVTNVPLSGGTTDGSDLFSAKDHNRDGVVDRNEWPDHAEFSRRDVNRDNVVTRHEYFAGEPTDISGGRVERFDRMDRNRDGILSRSEWKGGSRTFERADLNRDGIISRDEYQR